MIVKRHTREEVLAKLHKKIKGGKPIFVAACGTGLVAKCLEQAGADFIVTFSGARLRNNGWGTMSQWWPILDSNQQVMENTSQDIMSHAVELCRRLGFPQPFQDEIALPAGVSEGDLHVEVKDASGASLLAYRPEALSDEPLPEPQRPPPPQRSPRQPTTQDRQRPRGPPPGDGSSTSAPSVSVS